MLKTNSQTLCLGWNIYLDLDIQIYRYVSSLNSDSWAEHVLLLCDASKSCHTFLSLGSSKTSRTAWLISILHSCSASPASSSWSYLHFNRFRLDDRNSPEYPRDLHYSKNFQTAVKTCCTELILILSQDSHSHYAYTEHSVAFQPFAFSIYNVIITITLYPVTQRSIWSLLRVFFKVFNSYPLWGFA